MKATSISRDRHLLAHGDPQPAEGALALEELLRMLRDGTTKVEPQKIIVVIDPSGGGRDTAGVVGGLPRRRQPRVDHPRRVGAHVVRRVVDRGLPPAYETNAASR